jgi:hypothetical protein
MSAGGNIHCLTNSAPCRCLLFAFNAFVIDADENDSSTEGVG